VAVYCENDNEPSSSIRDKEFLERLSDQQLLEKSLLHGVDLLDILPILYALLLRPILTFGVREPGN
jgi:hypothetical protein